MIKVKAAYSNFEREPLKSPFGFKGNYVTEIWQSAAGLVSLDGNTGIGIGTQSTLWSDAGLFASCSEAAGNSMMFLMTEFALRRAKEVMFESPVELLESLFPEVLEFGKKITGKNDLRQTFALNALVAVDNAAWLLFARENDIDSFDEMIPAPFRPALASKHSRIASIPLISYGVSEDDIKKEMDSGAFFLKIKIGSDPDKDGNLDKMLDWDKQRISAVHEIAKNYKTQCTVDGKIPYYLDANGRYDSKDRLMRFLDHAEAIGALSSILIIEEPFPEELEIDVGSIPARLAADESAHTDIDAAERIQMGYGAIALKPIAKTLSMSLKIARTAFENNTLCFCADLTVNPILVDWNKNVAARLSAFPGLKTGLLETNGHQNYLNWDRMRSYHPMKEKQWTRAEKGLFALGDDFYKLSGGIFAQSPHYKNLLGL